MSIDVLGTDWTPFIVLGLFVVLAFLVPHWIRAFHRTESTPRAFTGRVNPDAAEWWLPTEDFFRGRLERDERFARAVDHAVYDGDDRG